MRCVQVTSNLEGGLTLTARISKVTCEKNQCCFFHTFTLVHRKLFIVSRDMVSHGEGHVTLCTYNLTGLDLHVESLKILVNEMLTSSINVFIAQFRFECLFLYLGRLNENTG